MIFTDPPYDTRSEQSLPSSEYDHLVDDQIDLVVSTVSKILRPGGHVVIFSSSAKSFEWIARLLQDNAYTADRVPAYCINSSHNMAQDP